jgi:HAE1 family hydrophobic/amphiphilic exporter-1
MLRANHLILPLVVALLAPLSVASAQTAALEQRVGVQRRVTLTLHDAVTMALENNRDIQLERLNVQMNEFELKAARGVYDPALSSSVFYDHRTTPVASLLAGDTDGKLTTSDLAGTTRLTQRLPWQGGSVQLTFDQNRATTGNLFYSLNPQFTSSLSVEFTQPLFRNRAIDAERRQIRIAKKKLDLSDSQFRQRAIEIIASVERAYWDLVFARRDEEIKRESVELARTQLAHNERKVAQGTLAPAEIISARVEVEHRTDEAEAAIETIQRTENALKALIAQPGADELWNAALVPVEKPALNPNAALPFDDALKLAKQNRSEMEQYRLRGEINRIEVDYFRNQTRPQVDFIAGYGTQGLAGTERTTTNPIVANSQLLFDRVNQLSLAAGLQPLPPSSFGATPEKFIGGYGQSLANMFSNEYRAWRVGLNINLSLRNRTAKAQLGRALVEGRRVDAERERTEQLIEVEVRNALQAVETAKRRAEAAKNSRVNAELQLTSEQHRFEAGLSTSYFVLDRQNALSAARGRELKALTDYHKAVSELQRTLSTTLVNNSVTIASR